MAARTFVVARGRINELAQRVIDNDGTDPEFFLAYYQGAIEADVLFEAHLVKTAVDGSNTIATFTNYGTDASRANVTRTITGTEQWCSADDKTIVNAGGVTNNTITRAVLYYADDISTPNTAIPLAHYQFDITTDGTNLTFDIPASGLYRTG